MKDLLSAYVAKRKAFMAMKTQSPSKGPADAKSRAKDIATAILAKKAPKDTELADEEMDLTDWESEENQTEPDTNDKFALVKKALEKVKA